MRAILKALYLPPPGRELRWVATWVAWIIGAGRIGLAEILAPGAARGINLVYQQTYGALFLTLAIGLTLTLVPGWCRRWACRVLLLFGIALYSMLAYDVWPVFVNAGVYAFMAVILTRELAAR